MRTAVRTGMEYVIENTDASISFCGSQFQLGLLRARELVPHGEVACRTQILFLGYKSILVSCPDVGRDWAPLVPMVLGKGSLVIYGPRKPTI